MTKAPIPVPCEHHEDRVMALARWQEHIRQLCLLVEQADEFTPSAFVKRVHEALPELRRAAMRAVIHIYVNSGPKEK
jgi:hypothetical protein